MNVNDVTPPSSPNSPGTSPVPPSIPPDIDGPVMQPMEHPPAGQPPHRSRKRLFTTLIVLVIIIVAAGATYAYHYEYAKKTPQQSATTSSKLSTKSTTPQVSTANVWKGTVNPKALPLGDSHLSTTQKAGYIDSCQTSFTGGGASTTGTWIDTANSTWNSEAKVAVEGSVHWPNASYDVTTSGNNRVITTNDLPENEPTGIFPITSTDPAYQFDHNPNHIATQTLSYTLPLNPVAAATPSCVGMGVIGVLDDGVVLYNGLDGEGRDAAAHEIQDSCDGHPDESNEYHYHDISSCILSKATGSSTLVGYAADGYGIYVERDKNGNLPTDADLDSCHGRTSEIMWNGKLMDMYHYDATAEYPYTVGCYHGTPIKTQAASPSGGTAGQKQQPTGPVPAP